jgi:acetate---CoA ligase (ADP-forming)
MSLQRLFDARSVAVVGASKTPTKRGYQAIRTLLDERYQGAIHPVNPGEDEILGLRCYPSVAAIEGPVDVALITTPARTLPAVLRDCGAKGVAAAVIIAGGFGEMGPEGRVLEEQVAAAAAQAGVRFVGPNTSGMINVHRHMNLVGMPGVPAGDIALLSQSGNMALALITEARTRGQQGFRYYVGVGNEADLRFHEYLEFLRDDDGTRAILMYVEGMRDGRGFLRVAGSTAQRKPIVMLKSGRSETGRHSAGSHSGALAGMAAVARTAFREAGVVVVEDSDELLPAAEALASQPPLRGGIAILADGGGHATIAADALTDLGVAMPPLGEGTRERLRALLPAAAAVANPIDVAGATDDHPGRFADCAEILLQDPAVGGVLMVGLFGGYGIRFAAELAVEEQATSGRLAALARESGKPLVVHSLYEPSRPEALRMLAAAGVPVHGSVEVACKCIGVLAEYGAVLDRGAPPPLAELGSAARRQERGVTILEAARCEGRHALLEPEARELVGLHGVPVGEAVLAADADAAAEAARRWARPLAMKVVSPQILHKSDAGGVVLGVEGEVAAREAFARIAQSARAYDAGAEVRGVLVAPMAVPGVEIIVGTKVDDQFGPVILFGLGGVLVEVAQDVVFRVLPVTLDAARAMVGEIASVKLLDGYRGGPVADREAIAELLVAVSEIVESYPEIAEMDLNPVLVHQRGLTVVDARVLTTT